MAETTAGRPMKVRKAMMHSAGRKTAGSSAGVTSRPSRKKIITWHTPVTTSKKWMR